MLRLDMELGSLRRLTMLSVLGLVLSLDACTSSPPGAITSGTYLIVPATIMGPPAESNVFFEAAGLSTQGKPYFLVTVAGAGHVPANCTGTTSFPGADMVIDWACTSGATTTYTVAGTMTWDGERYFGDCETSYVSATYAFDGLIIPFGSVQ
jgi:hypothetical protein